MQAPAAGTLAATQEVSGEIRWVLRFPRKGKNKLGSPVTTTPQAAGRRALVHSEKSGETTLKDVGRGSVPAPSEFSSAAKRAVKNGCAALERKFGKNCVFGTLTLPGSTNLARATLAAWSSKCVELINKWREYHAPDSLWVYKWEWQKNGALHLHFAIGSMVPMHLWVLRRTFKSYAFRLFRSLSRLSGCDLFARVDGGTWWSTPRALRSRIEKVHKSVARYMAKYLTKPQGNRAGFSPSRWWGQSRQVRALVRAGRRCLLLRSWNWEGLYQRFRHGREYAAASAEVWFEYSEPFAPHNSTVLAYAESGQAEMLYGALKGLLKAA